MRHQRFIVPLLPIAISLILGIILGKYVTIKATILLASLVITAGITLCVSRFPRIQTMMICLSTAMMGSYLLHHPLPDIPMVQQAGYQMLEYRQQLLGQYRQQIPPETYEVTAAMTLGDKSSLTTATRKTFNITGAGHILAISGLHLGIIYMIVSLLFRGRRGRMAAQVITLVLLWAFAFLVGMSPSVVRAATMLTVYGLLSLGYRRKMSINVLAFTAILILVAQPQALFDIGFQMSYLAVLAILLFFPILNGIISEKWLMEHRLIRWIWGMMTVSLSAQLGVAPLIAFYFHRFSTYFLLTNFIVIPCSYLILTGSLILLITTWSAIGTALTTVVYTMNTALTRISALPYASIEGLYPNEVQTILLYMLIGCLWVIFLKTLPQNKS